MDSMSAPEDGQNFALIYELANAFVQRLELDELIPFALQRCRDLVSADGVSILLLDADSNELYFPYVAEEDPEAARRLANVRIPADHGVAGAVLQSGQAELIADARNDKRFYSGVDNKTGTTTGSLLAAPLIAGQTRLGVIEAVRRVGARRFTGDELALLKLLAGSVAVALENANRFSRIKESENRLKVEVGELRRELARNDLFAEIIAVSPAMSEVFRRAEAAAVSVKSLLIQGETGTGKELIARAVHRISARAAQPFVAINCAAVPEGLLESELFGHRRGAFSGATDDQLGLFRAASGGVLFLDEIGEMPTQMQAKLLRVLQEGEIKPVGDTRSHKVDVRIISATNRDLEADIATRAFRKDLFYRLTAFIIRLPPLRERREDVQLMVARFVEAAARTHDKRIAGISREALVLLENADWPGNVRQLQNEIEQAVGMAADGETLAPHHFSSDLMLAQPAVDGAVGAAAAAVLRAAEGGSLVAAGGGPPDQNTVARAKTLRTAHEVWEQAYLRQALAQHKGNVSHTALALNISRVALQQKMRKYSLR
jgi:transcriptional regulator with GAF, ATPase, and Fis domain